MNDIIDKNHHYERGYSAGYKAAIAVLADPPLKRPENPAFAKAVDELARDMPHGHYDWENGASSTAITYTRVAIKAYLTAIKEATCRT